MIGSEPMTVDAAVTHCANPKCRCGRPKGVPALVDQQGIAAAADRLWPVTTLANGRKVLKFCDVRCCHEYQDAQTKLPEEQRDPDVGTILCSRCGNEVRGLNMGGGVRVTVGLGVSGAGPHSRRDSQPQPACAAPWPACTRGSCRHGGRLQPTAP
jgi:hypothetical protein